MAFNGFSANSSWFNCAIRSSTYDFSGLEVYAFSGVEKINEAFEFTIDLVSKNGNLDLTEALGRECLLTIADKSGGKRLINSVIRQAEQLRGGNQYAMYRVVTAPRVDFLRLRMDHRIYQGQTVPQ
ncbi:MAG: phage late control D family protein, partial [Desulfobulbaceae bacterium]|nr:phage late control D family protein [Desulfobulbaceae bacterium]